MVSPVLRPRSPSELVDVAFQILRAHYPQFLMCSALAYLPWLVVDLLRVGDPLQLDSIDISANLLLALGWWLEFAFMSAVLLVCASQAFLGEPVDVGSAVRRTVARAPLLLIGAALRFMLIILGLFFFFFGALYPAARYFAVTPAIVLEGAGLGTAFTRSSELSKGRKWHIILTMGLVFVIYLVLALGTMFVVGLIQIPLLQLIVMGVFSIVAYPIVAITAAVLYYDTRIKSEGLDIELMAGALDAAPPREAAAP
jgi:hypothetical protein